MWAAGGDAVVDMQRRDVGGHDKIVEAVWTAMLAAAVPPWRLIETLEGEPDELVWAVCADRKNRQGQPEPIPMVWAVRLLRLQMDPKQQTPHHLDFGATHWMPLDDFPLPPAKGGQPVPSGAV